MKKSLFIALVASFFVASPSLASTFYLADDAITIDNVVDEAAWDDHKVVTDKEDDANRTRFCWNTTIQDWDELTTNECTTYLYDPLGQIDLLDGWFGINETNMILAFETAVPMFAIKDMAADQYIEVYNQAILETGITELPAPFDHDMVFAFDANPAEGNATSFDWYLVANIQYDLSQQPEANQEDFLQVVQESGDHDGFQADEDVVIDTLDTTQSESANDGGVAAVMEIRQNVEHFYELTGMTAGDEVKFRLETHSAAGDTTKAVRLVFVDSNEITEDALVVGNGATAFDGRSAKKFAPATVTAYSLGEDPSIQLQFEAYDKKVGVQVATGDVTGDGETDIVTLPFRPTSKPEWKVFSKTGELVASGTIAKEDDLKRLKKYHLAVGDVDGDGQDEIVLSNASGNRLLLDVFTLNDGELSRVDQYDATDLTGYANGAWVEVANLDQSEDGTEEIVTAPTKGSAVLDVFSVTDGVITADFTYAVEQSDFAGGLHIAAIDGAVLVAKHSADGDLQLLTWDDETESFATGPMDTINSDTTLGKIGSLAWFDSGNYAYSSFPKKTVTYHSYDAERGDEDTVTTDVSSRASFVEFFDVE